MEDLEERLETLLLQQAATLRILSTTFTDLELYGELSSNEFNLLQRDFGESYLYYKGMDVVAMEGHYDYSCGGDPPLLRSCKGEGRSIIIESPHLCP